MDTQNQLFDNYLTEHFAHVVDARFRARRKVFIHHNYARYLPSSLNAKILEIGPGFGEVLEWLTKDLAYSDVKAIDLSREVVDHCNDIVPGSTQLIESSTNFLNAHENKFDCIIMFHVLEHIPKAEVQPFLKALHRALAKGGKLLLEVPNMSSPITGINVRYADFTHEVGFTELSMQYLLQRTGFPSINIFEARLAYDRWSRPLQFALQRAARFVIYLMYRAWAIHPPRVLSPVLCVCATK